MSEDTGPLEAPTQMPCEKCGKRVIAWTDKCITRLGNVWHAVLCRECELAFLRWLHLLPEWIAASRAYRGWDAYIASITGMGTVGDEGDSRFENMIAAEQALRGKILEWLARKEEPHA